MSRYERNFPAFSEEDFERIQHATVCVVGCGGLGGYIIEMLARVGIGALILIDGDGFKAGAKTWLKKAVKEKLYTTEKTKEKKIMVFSLSEFFTWANKTFE